MYRTKLANVFTPYEQIILVLEGHSESDVIKMIEADPRLPFEVIRDAWDGKWSKVYCPVDSGSDGYIDILLLRTSQFQTIYNLYNNTGRIKANINRVVGLTKYNDYSKAADNPNTLSDIIEKMLREKWGQIAASPTLGDDIADAYKKLKTYGALKFEELSPEEQARQLELSIRVPEKKEDK